VAAAAAAVVVVVDDATRRGCDAALCYYYYSYLLLAVKVTYCRQTYEELRVLFDDLCGEVVDAGNALWLGLAVFVVAAIFLFFFSLQLMNAARTAGCRAS